MSVHYFHGFAISLAPDSQDEIFIGEGVARLAVNLFYHASTAILSHVSSLYLVPPLSKSLLASHVSNKVYVGRITA